MAQAAARARAERINIQIITAYAARRARMGEGLGDRGTSGAARGAMELTRVIGLESDLFAGSGSCAVVEITAPGALTARRRLPAVLSRLDLGDPLRLAADRYALAAERIGAVAGVSAEGSKTDGGPASNDGGVTSRIGHAATIRDVEAALARAGVVLAPNARGGGDRRAITARALMAAICLEGADMKTILTGAGWSGQRRDVAKLTAQALTCLELMARALGIARLRHAPAAPAWRGEA